jgi:hypothetical protein
MLRLIPSPSALDRAKKLDAIYDALYALAGPISSELVADIASNYEGLSPVFVQHLELIERDQTFAFRHDELNLLALIATSHFADDSAHEAICRLLLLPGAVPQSIFEGAIKKHGAWALFATCPDCPDGGAQILKVYENAMDAECRLAAARALTFLGAEGRFDLGRLESIFMDSLMNERIWARISDFLDGVALCLLQLGCVEAGALISKMVEAGFLDDRRIQGRALERLKNEGRAGAKKRLLGRIKRERKKTLIQRLGRLVERN